MESCSIGPVVGELEESTYGWSGGERELIVWAAHFWNLERYPAHFPCRFDHFNFRRWIVACQLYKGVAPEASVLRERSSGQVGRFGCRQQKKMHLGESPGAYTARRLQNRT